MTMTDAELAKIRARADAGFNVVKELEGHYPHWHMAYGPDHPPADYMLATILRTDIPNLCDEVEALRGELARAREALGAAIPLLQTHSCWHDVFPELDCCEYGLVAEQASVALGNEPLPIYAEHMAALCDAGRGEGE